MALTKISSNLVADDAIVTGKIADGGVATADLAANAVTTAKIAQNNVTAHHIADGSITTTQLGADAVTNAKIADDAISEEHLDKTIISDLTEVTPVAGDFVLLGDTSDSNNLKKAPLTLLLNSNVDVSGKADLAGPTFTGDVDISGTDDLRLRFLNAGTFKGGIQVPTSTGDMISGAAVDDLAIRSQANMLFSTGGNTERMRIDSSGKVGIGTTSPSFRLTAKSDANTNPAIKVEQTGNTDGWGFIPDNTNGNLEFSRIGGGTEGSHLAITNAGNVGIGITSPAVTLHLDASGGAVMRLQRTSANASNKLELSHDGTDGTITSTNDLILTATNVGIGTTSPDSTLHVKGVADAYLTLEAGSTDGNTAILMQNSGGTQEAFILYDTDDDRMLFGVNSAERIRIASNGSVGIGTTSTSTRTLNVTQLTASEQALYINSTNSNVASNASQLYLQFAGDSSPDSGSKFVEFANQSAIMGSIKAASASTVQYNASSDERLKDNIVDADGQLETVLKTKVREYDWKNGGVHNVGFIAQELNEVIPDVVYTGGDDENEDPWQVDYGKLTPYLVKAIQEQQEQIETLKKEVEELKG